MIKIGRSELSVSKPDDLDARLIDLAGISAKEMRDLLRAGAGAPVLATALLPFLADPPPRAELARKIQAADEAEVRQAVLSLYDKAEPSQKEPASGKGKA